MWIVFNASWEGGAAEIAAEGVFGQIGMVIVKNTTGVEPGCIFYNQHPRLA